MNWKARGRGLLAWRRAIAAGKRVAAPLIYRNAPVGIEPSELGQYLYYLLQRKDVPGDVAEIGCSLGGTACLASRLTRRYSPNKSYICYDTFSGFVPSQVDADIKNGSPDAIRHLFQANSKALVRKILDMHGCVDVKLVEGDICAISDNQLSESYSVVLLDVDLEEPTYVALSRIYGRLTPGGIILVDDCRQEPGQRWHAYRGYHRFCAERGLQPIMQGGFGLVEKPVTEMPAVD